MDSGHSCDALTGDSTAVQSSAAGQRESTLRQPVSTMRMHDTAPQSIGKAPQSVGTGARRTLAGMTALAAVLLSACGSSEPGSDATAGNTATAGSTGGPVATGGSGGTSTGMSGAPSLAGTSALPVGGSGNDGVAGQPTGTGGTVAGTAGAPSGGTSSTTGGVSGVTGGSGGTMSIPVVPMGPKDHCLHGYDPLPSDETMAHGPAIYTPPNGGPFDTTVQPEVIQWMTENKWQGAHVLWHAIRGCNIGTAGFLTGPLGIDICKYTELIPQDQNCRTAGDGYQFLLFHRHMIESLKQLWPKHAADFEGFPKFPKVAEDVPEPWRESWVGWTRTASGQAVMNSEKILEAADIADNIEQHLSRFPDEGSLGFWLQCPVGQNAPSFAPQMPWIGLHFVLHDQWSRGSNSTHGLNNGQVNITNYMFWKLHGWIDNVWEKYRVAKGLTTDPAAMQKYRQDMIAQCREMDIEIEILKQNGNPDAVPDCPPTVDETGEFHTKVRPLFESDSNRCAGCHGPTLTSPYAGLTLGGAISSKCIVDRLKRESVNGGQFKLVEPGQPEKSWLYLKAAGLADTAGCVPRDANGMCNTAAMPPTGRTMTDAELEILRKWIADGANY